MIAGTLSETGHLVANSFTGSSGNFVWLGCEGDERSAEKLKNREFRAALVRSNRVWLATGPHDRELAFGENAQRLQDLASATSWPAVLGAAAVGWALGLAEADIAAGLASFSGPAAR